MRLEVQLFSSIDFFRQFEFSTQYNVSSSVYQPTPDFQNFRSRPVVKGFNVCLLACLFFACLKVLCADKVCPAYAVWRYDGYEERERCMCREVIIGQSCEGWSSKIHFYCFEILQLPFILV